MSYIQPRLFFTEGFPADMEATQSKRSKIQEEHHIGTSTPDHQDNASTLYLIISVKDICIDLLDGLVSVVGQFDS